MIIDSSLHAAFKFGFVTIDERSASLGFRIGICWYTRTEFGALSLVRYGMLDWIWTFQNEDTHLFSSLIDQLDFIIMEKVVVQIG
jgi:hypothetical protein